MLIYFFALSGFLGLTSCRGDKRIDSGLFRTDDVVDFDGDGFLSDEDCDDNNSMIYPDAMELCDGIDNNCDGVIDEDVTNVYFLDSDDDGFGDDLETIESCTQPEGYAISGGDCDDNNDTIYVGAPEQCDNLDNDCNDIIDDELTELWYADLDEDGFGSIDDSIDACMQPEFYVSNSDDCDDSNMEIHPDAEEVCDEIDNDCDDEIDEEVLQNFFQDNDNDGYGETNVTIEACEQPEGYSDLSGDCDDNDSLINPEAVEYCFDTVDNNCDGFVDDASSVDAPTWYEDVDADSYGDVSSSISSCYALAGYVADNTDCNDGDELMYPGALELCDGKLNDCNTSTLPEEEVDDDGDGYVECLVSEDWTLLPIPGGEDCNDQDATIFPSALELENGIDDNCDGIVDENTPVFDDDGDGFSENDGDCDDGNANIFPNSTELENGIDDDCDGVIDENTSAFDDDGDGFSENDGDCNDSNMDINPDATEVCFDSIDSNCDGQVDGSGCLIELVVSADTQNYDVNTEAGAPSSPVLVRVTVQSGVTISSSSATLPAFTTSQLPSGTQVELINNGTIHGAGGNGACSGDGQDGGDAINMTVDVLITNTNGAIYGGGGGGGTGDDPAGGGGGAGGGLGCSGGSNSSGGNGGNGGARFSTISGGLGSNYNGTFGVGGSAGSPGQTGSGGSGGEGGDGTSNCCTGQGGAGGGWGGGGGGGYDSGAGRAVGAGGDAGYAVRISGGTLTWNGGYNIAQVKGAAQ